MVESTEEPAASPVQRTVRGLTSRSMRDLDRSSVLSMELLSGVLVWGAAGWGLDHWIGTWPVLFVLGASVGFVAGMWLVYRRAMGDVPPPPARTTPHPSVGGANDDRADDGRADDGRANDGRPDPDPPADPAPSDPTAPPAR